MAWTRNTVGDADSGADYAATTGALLMWEEALGDESVELRLDDDDPFIMPGDFR